MASIISRNTGMARNLWVTTASIRSDRVGAPRGRPRRTHWDTTSWMNWYRASAIRVSRSPRS